MKRGSPGVAPFIIIIALAIIIGIVFTITSIGMGGQPGTSQGDKKFEDIIKNRGSGDNGFSALPTPKVRFKDSTPEPGYGDNGVVVPNGGPTTDKLVCFGDQENPYLPATGPTTLPVYFWATGEAVASEEIEGYQWDFDGDGDWDTDVKDEKSVTYLYDKEGTFKPKFRIKGTEGNWSETCDYQYGVKVGGDNFWTNEYLNVDRVNVTLTIKKSESNEDLVRNDNGNPTSGLNYGEGFTVGLKKKTAWRLKRIESEGDFGYFERAGESGKAGMGYKVHTYINPDLDSGEYKGKAILQFTEDNTWKDGPTVEYTINLAD